MPVNDGKKKFQNCELLVNFDGCSRIGPNPLAALIAQNNNASAASGRKIALNTSNFLMLYTPRYTMNIFSNQNKKKHSAGPVVNPVHGGKICGNVYNEGIHNRSIWKKAKPPIQVCMPNQPHATIARRIAGIFAPFVPKLALANTGNGIPYFAPA